MTRGDGKEGGEEGKGERGEDGDVGEESHAGGRTGRRTDQSKVVEEALTDLKSRTTPFVHDHTLRWGLFADFTTYHSQLSVGPELTKQQVKTTERTHGFLELLPNDIFLRI